MSTVTLLPGDCLEILPTLPAQSVDLVLADLPYEVTRNAWDSMIPLDKLWAEYRRVLKPSGAIVLTAAQPFTSMLVMSNPKWFKWADVWHKSQATGHLNAKVMPMREHEDIVVFGPGRVTYNPQIRPKPVENIRPVGRRAASNCYGKFKDSAERGIPLDMAYPRSVIRINNTNHGERGLHPTQKPVALFAYLIRTYSNPGDLVLDNCAGSGTTGVAALETGRRAILIEQDPGYCEIITRRLATAQPALEGVA